MARRKSADRRRRARHWWEQARRHLHRRSIHDIGRTGDRGSLQMYDSSTNSLVFRYVRDPDEQSLTGQSLPITKGISGQVFRSGEPDLTHQAKERPEFNPEVDALTGYETKSMLTVPLKRSGSAGR